MRPRAYPIYVSIFLVDSFVSAGFFTIAPLYRLQTAGMGALQLILIGTVMELTVLVFEIPTGVVADSVSRKWSVVIGTVITGLAFVLEGAVAEFWTILIAAALWGFGWTFISGALDAWITGEVGDEAGRQAIIRARQWGRLAAVAGVVVAATLALGSLRLPLLAGGTVLTVFGVFLAFAMPEGGFRPAPRGASWAGTLVAGVGEGIRAIRGRPLLVTLLVAAVVGGAASEAFDRLWEAHFILDVGLPAVTVRPAVFWVSAIRIGSLLLGIGAIELARRRIDFEDQPRLARALGWLVAVRAVGMAGFAVASGFAVALGFYLTGRQAVAVEDPVYTAWLATAVPQRMRATVLSMWGQLDAMGQIVAGPIVGIIGTTVSIEAALLASALALAPLVPLFRRAARSVAATD